MAFETTLANYRYACDRSFRIKAKTAEVTLSSLLGYIQTYHGRTKAILGYTDGDAKQRSFAQMHF